MLKRLSIYWFKKNGWRFIGRIPRRATNIVVVYGPHRKNADALIALAVKTLTYFRLKFVLDKKHCKWYHQFMLRALEVECLDGKHPSQQREKLINTLKDEYRSGFAFSFTPIGHPDEQPDERFYDIAIGSSASIILVAIDRRRKLVKFHNAFSLSGYRERDMSYITAFFRNYYNYDRIDRNQLKLVSSR